MDYQEIFERYELKYLLSKRQQAALLDIMAAHMEPDAYGRTSIRNIYFDTDDFRLVRRSLEKPVYKEKFRVRSYGRADADSTVFVELKKKYNSVVYKRRMALPEREAVAWLRGDGLPPEQTQIAEEMTYFFRFYKTLRPAVFLSYDREAYRARAGGDLRVTFDTNILYRREELSLCEDVWGTPLLEPEQALMEIKTMGGIPLWLVHFLTENRLYKTSFSKYGAAYTRWQAGNKWGGRIYAGYHLSRDF